MDAPVERGKDGHPSTTMTQRRHTDAISPIVPELPTPDETTETRSPVADGGKIPVPLDEGAPPLVPDVS